MEKSNRNTFLAILSLICIFALGSCVQNTAPSDPGLFLKTFETKDTSATSFFVNQMPDGGYFIVSAAGNSSLLLTRTNRSGNLLWEKTILKSGFLQFYYPVTSTPPWIFNCFNTADPAHLLAQSGYYLVKFDTTGTVEKIVYNGAINTEMIQQGTNYMVTSCDGLAFGTKNSTNVIYLYDQDLNLLQKDTFSDSRISTGRVLDFFVNKSTSPGTFDVLGMKYTKANPTILENTKLFAARIAFSNGHVIENVIDTGDQVHSDQMIWQSSSGDSGEILLAARTDVTTTGVLTYPVIIKFDRNLNIAWKKDYQVSNSAVFPSEIKLCRDGGFIIVGSIAKQGYGDNRLPYALKIDENGNKLWDKTILSLSNSGVFAYGTDLEDGGYAFVGSSSQFGKGKNNYKSLFVRTDANGNY